MGDRTNPIKFGPEWLRNLSREPASPGTQAGASREPGAPPPGLSNPRPVAANPNPSSNLPKVLLARLRYGREEMLALYDRQTAEAPAQLKSNDALYQPREKPPYALNNTFEEDTRDSVNRQLPGVSLLPPSDRYIGPGRTRSIAMAEAKSRVLGLGEGRGRGRIPPRPTSAGRTWQGNRVGATYSALPDDDPTQSLRPWSNNNHQTTPGLRLNSGEQPDWQTKQTQYRKRLTSTNWRQQPGRDEGEEWRSADGSRRPQDKWADWGWQQEASGRPTQDKQWHGNRRTWVGNEASEDALPEWAVDNAEACAGTFDSSGAFHGYSNDDSNLPKNQENPYPLTKSHTHGSFARSKMAEEGSEEWWASEKAKKLSPKRFDASEIQFKKPLGPSNSDEKSNLNSATTTNPVSNNTGTHTGAIPKRVIQINKYGTDKKLKDKPVKTSVTKYEDVETPETKPKTATADLADKSKTDNILKENAFESRSGNDKQNEKGGIQSVILTSNNSLRQKHQNITVTPTATPKRQPKLTEYMETLSRPIEGVSSEFESKETESNKIVEDILQMSLDDGIPSSTINQLLTSNNSGNSAMATLLNSLAQIPYPSQVRITNALQRLGLYPQNMQNTPIAGMQTPEAFNGMMPPIGITNSMLNASLGLPLPNSSTCMSQGITQSLSNTGLSNQNSVAPHLQGVASGNLQQSGLQMPNLQAAGLQSAQVPGLQGLNMQGLQGFGMQSGGTMQNQLGGLPNHNMQAGGPGPGLQSTTNQMSGVGSGAHGNNMQQPNNLSKTSTESVHGLHGLQQLSSQPFNNMMYGGSMMNQHPPLHVGMQMPPIMPTDLWYYEDPNNIIQGPFCAQEMNYWYRAGFFSPTLMVRRENDGPMRPLAAYGIMPFGPMDMLSPFPMSGGYDMRPQQSHDNMMNQQPGLGADGFSSKGPNIIRQTSLRQPSPIARKAQFNSRNMIQVKGVLKSGGPIRPRIKLQTSASQPLFQLVQNKEVQSLWGLPAMSVGLSNPDLMWTSAMNNNNNTRDENPINNLPLNFWNNQASEMPATPLLPEKMKTEEEILAQMRAAQVQGPTSPLSFFAESPGSAQDVEATSNAGVNANQQQKLITKEATAPAAEFTEADPITDKPAKTDTIEGSTGKANQNKIVDKTSEVKPAKEAAKVDSSKQKSKENTVKPKSKKAKDDKKEETNEVLVKEEEVKVEKRSAEPSTSPKIKKDDKSSKKDLDKEKKEWMGIKEGFTIVKGADKPKDKDSKKKAEEAKAAEEAERKRKEEEKLAAEEKKKHLEAIKKQQELQNQQSSTASRQAAESVSKKAPWSASSQALPSTRDGLTLAEIQRLEREKKLEQMKEQQQMMQIIAQQQAVALAREQEMQTGLGWAKKANAVAPSATLAEIQAEARKQAAAAVAAMAPREEAQPTPSPPVNAVPWATVHNGGGGFWDTPAPEPVKPVPKPADPKPEKKKKVTVVAPPKQENTAAVEFDMWCTNMLVSWRDTGIDVPTFVSFLRDIESPYEVKDYVKCYLGDTRESNDFARQFLEKRSRLMRVGMVTPSDDLCSPAVAVNPRTNSGPDHTDLKAKGKKTKKNKMLKVDARNILGFSVTASEDRINVGDIDTV